MLTDGRTDGQLDEKSGPYIKTRRIRKLLRKLCLYVVKSDVHSTLFAKFWSL